MPEGIHLNEYACSKGHEFYVHDGSEPLCCPFCKSLEWDYQSDAEARLIVKTPKGWDYTY